MGIAYEVGWK